MKHLIASAMTFFRSFSLQQLAMVFGPSIIVLMVAPFQNCSRSMGASSHPSNFTLQIKPLSYIVNSISSGGGSKGRKIVEIRSDEIAMLDADIDVGQLIINGELRCNPLLGRKVTIKAETIFVNGKFQCGNRSNRISTPVLIALKHSQELAGSASPAYRGMIVNPGGRLEFWGDDDRSEQLRLIETIDKGDVRLTLNAKVKGKWKVGDQVLIAPTSFSFREGERLTISGFDPEKPNVVILKTPVQFRHWGRIQKLKTQRGAVTLDERAEVSNLTRSIVIYADDYTKSSPVFQGGHVMVMKGGEAHVTAVEFNRMGQAGVMGRYPFHWHLAGNVSGQFIANSSIHDSFQRCITVHGTQNAMVDNNVCYNFFGHGIFLERGDETGNRITGNLVVYARVPLPQFLLLSSDNPVASQSGVNDMRFPATSSFWISNPDNYVVKNRAAGSQGTGFWMSFERRINSEGVTLATPLTTNTDRFDDNVAHATQVGITWDGAPGEVKTHNPRNPLDTKIVSAHYSPTSIPTFRNLQVFKNIKTGIYFRGASARFTGFLAADNGWSIFVAYNQRFINSTVVGYSDNLVSNGASSRVGIVQYDGPFELDNVDFLDFPVNPPFANLPDSWSATPIVSIGGARKFMNVTRGLRFSPEPLRRADVGSGQNILWNDYPSAGLLKDLDGTLTGRSNTYLVNDIAFAIDDSCETKPTMFTGLRVCDSQFDRINLFFTGGNNLKIPFIVQRSNGTYSLDSIADLDRIVNPDLASYLNKVGLVKSTSDTYRILFRQIDKANGLLTDLEVYASDSDNGSATPTIEVVGLGSNCILQGAKEVSSQAQLLSETESAYFSAGNSLYIRLRTSDAASSINLNSPGLARNYYSKHHALKCAAAIEPRIRGVIDSTTKVGTATVISGWACDYGNRQPVAVHIYAGGPYGVGQLIGSTKATVASENAVGFACGADGSHRFNVSLTAAQTAGHSRQPLYVYGIPKVNRAGGNQLLSNSGQARLP